MVADSNDYAYVLRFTFYGLRSSLRRNIQDRAVGLGQLGTAAATHVPEPQRAGARTIDRQRATRAGRRVGERDVAQPLAGGRERPQTAQRVTIGEHPVVATL